MILYVVAALITMTLTVVYLLYEQPIRTAAAVTTSSANKPVNKSHVMHKRPEDGALTKARRRLSVTTWATPIIVTQTSAGATSVAGKTGNESTSTQTLPDVITGTSTSVTTEISISATARTTQVTHWTFKNTSTFAISTTSTTDTVSMVRPFVYNEDIRERERREQMEARQQRLSRLHLDGLGLTEYNDYRRRYGLRDIQIQQWLLQGRGQRQFAPCERMTEQIHTPLFTVLLLPNNIDVDTDEKYELLFCGPLNSNRDLLINTHADNPTSMLIERLRQMGNFVVSDQETMGAIEWLKNTLSSSDTNNWILLIVIIATMNPHPNDTSVAPCNPGRLSIKQATRMLVGPRGIVHGWGGTMPNIVNALVKYGNISSFLWSNKCAIDAGTDGDSSYESDSVDYETSSLKSGPRGVAAGRPPVTGMSSLSETSSVKTSDNDLIHELNTTGNPDDADGCFRLMRFKAYMKRSATERRERRAMRRARRETRKKYNCERRLNDPAYNMEARRAEILSAELLRKESRSQELLNAERKTERVLQWCKSQQAILAGDYPMTPSDERIDRRLKKLRQSLCDEISHTWKLFYEDKMIAKASREGIDEMVFHCWMTPIRWIPQNGPSCGLAVLAMAACPVLTSDVTLGDAQDDELEAFVELDEVEEKVLMELSGKDKPKAERSTNNIIYPPNNYRPNIEDFQREAIKSGFSGHGEMFSTQAMVNLARRHQTGHYNVTMVNRDLFGMTEEKDDTNTEPEIKSVVEQVEDACIGPANLNTNGLINESKQNVDPRTNKSKNKHLQPLSSSTLNAVQRLMRGYLVAVCFDCDRSMMPSSVNGGSTAHWALLCGVIIGKSIKKPKKIHQYDKPEFNPFKYGYLNPYNSNSIEFLPSSNIDKIIRDPENPIAQEITDSSLNYMEHINFSDIGMAQKYYDDSKKNVTEEQYYCNMSNQDLKRNADRVWVIARHGKKSAKYAVWSLKELAESNCQLHTPAHDILDSIPPEIKMLWNNDYKIAELESKKLKNILNKQNYDSTNHCDLHPTETGNRFQRLERTNVELPIKRWPEENTRDPVSKQIQAEELSPSLSTTQKSPKIQLAPPPPPPPPPPPSVIAIQSLYDNKDESPFVLPEGPRLDLCLAHKFVSFEPVRVPYKISDDNNSQILNPLSTLLCQFSFTMDQDIKQWSPTEDIIHYWPEDYYHDPTDSSPESSTSPVQQRRPSSERRRRSSSSRSQSKFRRDAMASKTLKRSVKINKINE